MTVNFPVSSETDLFSFPDETHLIFYEIEDVEAFPLQSRSIQVENLLKRRYSLCILERKEEL